MSQPITKAHIKLSMSYAGILSYCTLLVRLVEDIAINHRFDGTDNLTMITSVTAIVVAAVTLLGGQISGTQDTPDAQNTGDAAATLPVPDQATPVVSLPLPGSVPTLSPVTIALAPAGPGALTAAPAAAVAPTAPAAVPVAPASPPSPPSSVSTPDASVPVAPVAPVAPGVS